MTESEKDPKDEGERVEGNETSDSVEPEQDSTLKKSGDDSVSDHDDEESDAPDSERDDTEDGADEEEIDDQRRGDQAESRSGGTSILIGVLALAAGFGVGWFGHDYQTEKANRTADAAVEGKGEAARGPCKEWETALCTKFLQNSHPCVQAQAASALLTGSACEQAIKTMDAKVSEIEASRAPCTGLMEKLCTDLGAESQACGLVKTQTPSFPPDRCGSMMENYDQVLQQLKMMEARGAIPGAGGPPHGAGPGGPPGAPPGHPPMRPQEQNSSSAPPPAPPQARPAPAPQAQPAPAPVRPAPVPAPAPAAPIPAQ